MEQQQQQMQQRVAALQAEAELLRCQLLTATQEKLGHTQEVSELHKNLREALSKVSSAAAVMFDPVLIGSVGYRWRSSRRRPGG